MADPETPLLARIRGAVIGDDQVMHGLQGYLDEALPATLSPDFDDLSWFELLARCLSVRTMSMYGGARRVLCAVRREATASNA